MTDTDIETDRDDCEFFFRIGYFDMKKLLNEMTKKQRKVLVRIIISAAIEAAAAIPLWIEPVKIVLFVAGYLVIGYDILLKALKGLKNRQPCDENFLMAVASIGAMVLGEFAEGAFVMLFYQIGELFQSLAVGKSRKNISALMDIRPDYANLERDDGLIEEVDPDEVETGSVIVVKPGEKIPIDGVVIEGSSTLNTAALTGESLPRDVSSGDSCISGCINLNGILRIRTTKEFGDSTVSRILDLVENASSRKSHSENFITKFARVYTPAVCIAALAPALIPPLAAIMTGMTPDWSRCVYRALSFLVVSCPCALVISIPLTFFAGLGGASCAGVLIKGSNYMETLSKVKHVVFDKTGTLTKGVFEVSRVIPADLPERELIFFAAHAEAFSSHPISRSIVEAYGREPDLSCVSDVNEIAGKGVVAKVDAKEVAVGNAKLMTAIGAVGFTGICGGAEASDCHDGSKTDSEKWIGGTEVFVAVDNRYAGSIIISDVLKPDSKAAIAALKAAGVDSVTMLTGDSKAAGEQAAAELGIDRVFCELLPEDKVTKLEMILSEGTPVAFVGDGINDAPVLSRADVGIAMGALGSDAAIEAADVVLMDDNPLKIAKSIRISRKCLRIACENIFLSISVKVLCLVLVGIGMANMWIAIFADVGVMVMAVFNAIRAMKVD